MGNYTNQCMYVCMCICVYTYIVQHQMDGINVFYLCLYKELQHNYEHLFKTKICPILTKIWVLTSSPQGNLSKIQKLFQINRSKMDFLSSPPKSALSLPSLPSHPDEKPSFLSISQLTPIHQLVLSLSSHQMYNPMCCLPTSTITTHPGHHAILVAWSPALSSAASCFCS